MNTWGYLILIAALLLLSAYMLYARFAARSREKSLHHAPAESGAMMFESLPEPAAVDEVETETFVMDLKPVEDAPAEQVEEDEKKEDDSYFDDLQEAAAGLAMLMRSSPTQNRSEPVVFAPEVDDEIETPESVADDSTDEAILAETCEDLATPREADEVEVESSPVVQGTTDETLSAEEPSIREAMDQVEAILDEPPVFEGEEADLSNAQDTDVSAKPSLEALLGEEVSEQISRLDTGLDELESLVVDIEEQLQRFDEFVSSPTDEVVEEAA